MTFKEILIKENISLTDIQIEQFEKYCDLLIEWNEKFNLTAITNKDDVYIKHFIDCMMLNQYNLQGKLVDVGTGAGFPGIVLKITNPNLDVTLLEPNNKKILFLNEVINKLNLENIKAINQRSEDFAKQNFETFDFVTSRAVAALNILDELCLPLIKVNGHFLAMKGPKANEELQIAEKGIKILGGQVVSVQQNGLGDDNCRIIIDIEKRYHCDKKYPRNFSQLKSKPL